MRFRSIAGSFGARNIDYDGCVFQIGRTTYAVERVVAVEENAKILESSWVSGLKNGATLGAAAVPVGALTGLFVTGSLAVAPFVVTAAAIGAGIGYMGGKSIDRALIQVVFDDQRGFVAIAEKTAADVLRRDLAVAKAAVSRFHGSFVEIGPERAGGVIAPPTGSLLSRSRQFVEGTVAGAKDTAGAVQSRVASVADRVTELGGAISNKLRRDKP